MVDYWLISDSFVNIYDFSYRLILFYLPWSFLRKVSARLCFSATVLRLLKHLSVPVTYLSIFEIFEITDYEYTLPSAF